MGNTATGAIDPDGLAELSISAAPQKSWWQQTTDWLYDVWSRDFVDEHGMGTTVTDSAVTDIARRLVHQNLKPIGGGVVDTGAFAFVSVPRFAYDNSIGIPIQGWDQTVENNRQRIASLKAGMETLSNWDQVPDYMAGRIAQRIAAQSVSAYAGQAAIARAIAGLRAPSNAGTNSAVQGRNLARQLTSQEQTAQALAGKGEAVFGAGTNRPLLDAQRLSQQYGGNPADWAKMRGASSEIHGIQTPAGNNFEIHWYQNVKTGHVVELKTKVTGH